MNSIAKQDLSKVPKQLQRHVIKPGQALNPGGQPKHYKKIGRAFLESIDPKDPQARTRWERGISNTYDAWLRGSINSGVFLRDTFYGKPKETLDINQDEKLTLEMVRSIQSKVEVTHTHDARTA